MQDIELTDISSQVEKIVRSSEFSGGKRLTQLLRYVTEQKTNSREGHLKQYTIAVEALGYPESFDPQSNPSVRILAKRLRRALDLYYATEGSLDPIHIKIPKGTYVPSFSRNVNSTPAHVINTASHGRASEADTLSAKLNSPSIGVVLFRSLNDSNDLDYIGSGITEELIISLTRFKNFRVIGPLFREVFRKESLDIYTIGTTYNIRFILEGTIRQREESLHITAKLIDTTGGQNIWGETIKCDVRNGSLAACEEQIVNTVAATVGDNFGVMNTVLSRDALSGKSLSSKSYEAILRFYHYIMMLTEESYIEALNALEDAARQEPNNAFCLAALGDLLITSYFTGYDESGSVVDRVEELGRKSVALDPNCQQARFTMAMVYFARLQKTQFISEASHVLRMNPNNANLVAALSMHLWMAGEHEQGKKLMAKAMSLNPHHPGWCHMVSFCHHYGNGDFAEALADAQKINAPELYIDPLFRAAAYGQLNNQGAGRSAVSELISLMPNFKGCGREIMKRVFFLDEHVDMLWDGLEKAGIGE